MGLSPYRAMEFDDFAPCRRPHHGAPPAPRRDRDDAVDRAMQPNQRRERFLHHPADARIRPVATRIAHRRHVVDHVAKRGRLDEQDIGHGLKRTAKETSNNRFFTEMRVGTGTESHYGRGS